MKVEALIVKIYLFTQPYLSVLGGTALHGLFSKNIEIEEHSNGKTFFGWLILLSISIGLGIFARLIAIAYYDLNPELEVRQGVINVSQFTGAALGFSGTVWLMNKLKSTYDDAKDAVLQRYSGKNRRRNEYRDPYEDEYRQRRSYNDEEDI